MLTGDSVSRARNICTEYVDDNGKETEIVRSDSAPVAQSDIRLNEICAEKSASPAITTPENIQSVHPDDGKPPGNDKPNRKITLLTVIGILLVGCVVLLLIPGLSAGLTLLFYLCPLIGVGLYFLAKRMRQKVAYAIANGAKGPDAVLSAHYYRFQLMLDLFFLFALIGGCFLLLGNYTNVIASGIIGAFGSVLTTASILLTGSIALILLVLLMFYIFRWRKDPGGYAPKRIRHPRKDG